MIERVIEFSSRHRFLVIVLVGLAAAAGWWCLRGIPVDAIPDLSETQVIIYSTWDRSPDIIEDQVTHPIVSALLGAPRVRAVRGISDFGSSYVYVIFEDGTNPYWGRSRTLEYLSQIRTQLPEGVKVELGPDATGLGWVFEYILTDPSGRHTLAELRSYQDWYLRYQLKSVPGVAEVASFGGFEPEFQVNLDPTRLKAFGIPMARVAEAVKAGNSEAGGRLIDVSGAEYMVRGRGYARSVRDIEEILLSTDESGAPVRVRDVGQVLLGPQPRRGVSDLDGTGEAVSGIVIMRQGANALEVIRRVKDRIHQVESGLPAGVKVVPIYDRSALILRSLDTLRSTLIEVVITVALVVLLFLWHVPSAVIPILTIPLTIVIVFVPFRALGVTANIMSLSGIAIAIGALVDAGIVVVEQTHKKLEEGELSKAGYDRSLVVVSAIQEVGRPAFFALVVLAVSFLPLLALQAQEGKLFKPLAYTKTLALLIAAILAITLDPALRVWFANRKPLSFSPGWLCRAVNTVLVGRIHREENHPVSRVLVQAYTPVVHWSLRHKKIVITSAVALVILTIPVFLRLGSEFMPALDEGDLLYMPSTAPGISISQAHRLLQATDGMLKQFPEVDRVLGKAGRAETSTDPAPLSMLETIVRLRPADQWRPRQTWYSTWAPTWSKPVLRHITPDHITQEELVAEMNGALAFPGVSNSWTMPVRGRIDMLSTGIRTPAGLKISGPDPEELDRIGSQVEAALRSVPGTRSAFAERLMSGRFLDITWNRERLSRHGMSLADAQSAVQSAIGGQNVTVTIDGPARYPVRVRYMRDFRSDPEAISQVLVAGPGGKPQIPLGELAAIRVVPGPSMLRDEDGMLTSYVYADVSGRDLSSYLMDADRAVRRQVAAKPGYSLAWSGQYEAMERTQKTLWAVVPATLVFIALLLWLNMRSMVKTLIVLTAIPFSAVGAVWLLYLLGYNLSVAVWVGLISLLGVDAETGVFMLLYLELACERARGQGKLNTLEDLRRSIVAGAAKRIRPKLMTVSAMLVGLAPILWANGTGADTMKRIAAPMLGGIVTSFLLELVIYPPIYEIWKGNTLSRREYRLMVQSERS